ncbi:MAG TPA: glycosyltransferase [Aggregatilineaceae bacterium]|nr:glycosyltransferase [Aggregatilineaceae bacterium]
MDLLLISRCPPFPLYRGDRLIPYHLARELSKRRYHIDLFAYYQEPADIAEVPRYERFFRSVKLIREPSRTPLNYWQRSRKPDRRFPRCAEDAWSPEMWNAIQHNLESHVYDAVHLFGGIHVYEYWELIKRFPNLIAPYESYSLWLERALAEETGRWAKRVKRFQYAMAQKYESWMFDNYSRVVVLTDQDSRALKTLNPHTMTAIIPNGVDTDFFTPTGFEPEEPTLLFTGNYDYPPNLDAALRLARDIFPQIKKYVPKARLYIVGGSPSPELQSYASDSIEITGRVPDLRPYFEQSLIFVSPLRYGAGIKNKILEAMAMEKPVVATPLSCDGIPVLQGHHAMLGISDDDLVKSVFRLLKDPNLRQTLSKNGRQLVEQQFTWQRVADLYEDLYMQVIKEHREQHSQY